MSVGQIATVAQFPEANWGVICVDSTHGLWVGRLTWAGDDANVRWVRVTSQWTSS